LAAALLLGGCAAPPVRHALPPALADQAVVSLRSQGVGATKTTDPSGRQIVRIGPVATWQEAQSLRSRFLGQYPDAFIVP